jgi:hypothetical protein
MLYESSTTTSANTGAFNVYILGGEIVINSRYASGNLQNKYPVSTGRQVLTIRMQSGLNTNSFSDLYINGTKITLATATGAGNSVFSDQVLYVGARAGTSIGFTGKRQASILYSTDQSANRVGIETNLNNYYGIY